MKLSQLYGKIQMDLISTPARRRSSSLMLAPKRLEKEDQGRNIITQYFPDSSVIKLLRVLLSRVYGDNLLARVSVWMSGEARSWTCWLHWTAMKVWLGE